MTDLGNLDSDQQSIALQVLYTRALCFNSMPMKGDGRHWFLAMAEDLKTAAIEAGVPKAALDAQDAKHKDTDHD